MTTPTDRESVEQALAELGDVVRCRCHEAYTGRGLHDPDCQCDSADAVAIVRAALDEAEAENERLRVALTRIQNEDQHQDENEYGKKRDGYFAAIARAALDKMEKTDD